MKIIIFLSMILVMWSVVVMPSLHALSNPEFNPTSPPETELIVNGENVAIIASKLQQRHFITFQTHESSGVKVLNGGLVTPDGRWRSFARSGNQFMMLDFDDSYHGKVMPADEMPPRRYEDYARSTIVFLLSVPPYTDVVPITIRLEDDDMLSQWFNSILRIQQIEIDMTEDDILEGE